MEKEEEVKTRPTRLSLSSRAFCVLKKVFFRTKAPSGRGGQDLALLGGRHDDDDLRGLPRADQSVVRFDLTTPRV